MLDTAALLDKHRSRGVLVDANLLVLLLVGSINKDRITKFKRTESFDVDDFDLLSQLINWFGTLVTTPHVLSQASDLTDLSGAELKKVRNLFRLHVEKMDERYEAGTKLVTHPLFARLGLADVAIANVSARGVLVLTSDFQLYVALQDRGVDAINFNHIRPLGWNPRP